MIPPGTFMVLWRIWIPTNSSKMKISAVKVPKQVFCSPKMGSADENKVALQSDAIEKKSALSL